MGSALKASSVGKSARGHSRMTDTFWPEGVENSSSYMAETGDIASAYGSNCWVACRIRQMMPGIFRSAIAICSSCIDCT